MIMRLWEVKEEEGQKEWKESESVNEWDMNRKGPKVDMKKWRGWMAREEGRKSIELGKGKVWPST